MKTIKLDTKVIIIYTVLLVVYGFTVLKDIRSMPKYNSTLSESK